MIIGFVGILLCLLSAAALAWGMSGERLSRAILGIVLFLVLWMAGFMCFAGASS